MCGIAGIINFNNKPLVFESIFKMAEIQLHRGPDGFGYAGFLNNGRALFFKNKDEIDIYNGKVIGYFGHRRLSIIDLSANAAQPMTNEDAALWLTFNGEIYNYIELKKELVKSGHIFKSNSDSEVVLHSYEEWGIGCLERFNGMFAFAIYDTKRNILFCSRDRLGIKPFYYYFKSGCFVFASEIKGIVASGFIKAAPNRKAISEYIAEGYTVGEHTWFKDVRKLEPGFYLKVDRNGIDIKKYWEVSRSDNDCKKDETSLAEELKELLKRSISLHARSDVEIGAHLSGGIDSSGVTALLSRLTNKPLHTFSGAFLEGAQYDERKYISLVTEKFKTIHHEIIPDGLELPNILPDLIWHMDEPCMAYGIFPQYKICELTKKCGIKVVNGGQGGDEIFGGYTRHLLAHLKDSYNKNVFTALKNGIGLMGSIPFKTVLDKLLFRKLTFTTYYSDEWKSDIKDAAFRIIEEKKKIKGNLLSNALIWDQKYYLQGLLQVEDRMSMAASIESRVPLLDFNIVEWANKIPVNYHINNGYSKAIFRKSLKGIVPLKILRRKDKKGFPTPVPYWFSEKLSGWVEDLCLSSSFRGLNLFTNEGLKELTKNKKKNALPLWRYINIGLWHQRFIK